MQIRRERNLDIVLDNAVWVDKKYDITDQVIEILKQSGQFIAHAFFCIFQAAHFVIASRAVSTAWQSPKIIFK